MSSKPVASPIYESRVLTTTIALLPKYLNNKDIQTIILNVLKAKVEGSCISDGYIKKDSVAILSRSLGCMENHDFSANVSYLIK
jgi:DNA-directed RNA polymerase subunit E'/Rpb7